MFHKNIEHVEPTKLPKKLRRSKLVLGKYVRRHYLVDQIIGDKDSRKEKLDEKSDEGIFIGHSTKRKD